MAPLLDLTPPPIREPLPTAGGPRPWVAKSLDSRRKEEAAAAQRQRDARMRRGIDWSTCLVPGCGRMTMSFMVTPEAQRDPLQELPLCDTHGVVAWKTVQFHRPQFREAIEDVERIRDQRVVADERRQVVIEQGGDGVIYFLRHNGLIKVGWTTNFLKRLRAYGPSTVVLCHYSGTRADETNLHRQLRPSLAKGREWYHDDQRIQLYLESAIKQHGQPYITDGGWTEPKADLAARRRRRSA